MFKYRNMMTFRSKNLLVGILLMAAYTNIVDAQPNCGQTSFSGDQGVIRSPGYPNNYDSWLYCDYTITVPLGSFIHLTFITFDLRAPIRDDRAETVLRCTSDYVVIYQGAGPSSSEVMYPELLVSGYTPADEGKLCGHRLPPDFRSSANVMTVGFLSGGSVQNSGFELEWGAIRAPIDFDGCGIRPPGSDDTTLVRGISKRIIGGNTALPFTWPFICVLESNITAQDNGDYVCAGTLVRNSYGQFHLITAAHCVDATVDAQTYEAHCAMHALGLPTARVDVKRVVIHRQFDDYYDNNDIAILELDTHQAKSYGLQAACIANEEPFVDEDAVVLGWGMTEQGTFSWALQELIVKIKAHGECANYPKFNEHNEICAGTGVDGFGACPGDSGGPLLTFRKGKWFLIGVVSGGGTYSQPCGRHDNFHTVYTDVFKYRNWIQRHF